MHFNPTQNIFATENTSLKEMGYEISTCQMQHDTAD